MSDRGLLFQPLSWIYGAVIRARNFLYDSGIKKAASFNKTVVSIGNLSVGGTGKTPLTMLVAKELGGEVAIVSRGYKSRAEHKPSRLVTPSMEAAECGDEPLLMKRYLPMAEIWVGKNRRESIGKAEKSLILLDDGMQHRQVARDFELVVVDGRDPFAGGHLLPRGNLREPKQALARADLIVAIDGPAEEVKLFTSAPIVEFSRALNLEAYQGLKVAAFCGIGQPDQFFLSLEQGGIELVDTWVLPDHIRPSLKALTSFALLAKKNGAQALLCTEKDAIKLPKQQWPIPLHPTPLKLQLIRGRERWEKFIEQMRIVDAS